MSFKSLIFLFQKIYQNTCIKYFDEEVTTMPNFDDKENVAHYVTKYDIKLS